MCLDQINDPPSLTSVQEQMWREYEYRASTRYSGSFPGLQYFTRRAEFQREGRDLYVYYPSMIFLPETYLGAF